MESRCKFWLPKKNRFCANVALINSLLCGNHTTRSDDRWIPCPIDPSHSVLEGNIEGHLKRCPLLKHMQLLSAQPFYQKGINGGKEEDDDNTLSPAGAKDFHACSTSLDDITSQMKRRAVHSMSAAELLELISKIKSVHASICNDIRDSYKIPEACAIWINREDDRKLPFQEKHVIQQASIIGNLEELGVLKSSSVGLVGEQSDCNGSYVDANDSLAVVEFGAGRGYLTQMLADCYGITKVFLVERKSYKLKADRSLRQKESLMLERLRIDIEDLNLNAVESLQGLPYLAIGKHLCGPATDMTLRCCIGKQCSKDYVVECSATCYLRGLAIATCCHHLCQWKHYINKSYLSNLGIGKEDFHAIAWFTSWAVDADHGSDLSGGVDCRSDLQIIVNKERGIDTDSCGVDDISRNMTAMERALLGFMCKDIIDTGRLMWMKEHGLGSRFVKYVPSNISPENHLLIARNNKSI